MIKISIVRSAALTAVAAVATATGPGAVPAANAAPTAGAVPAVAALRTAPDPCTRITAPAGGSFYSDNRPYADRGRIAAGWVWARAQAQGIDAKRLARGGDLLAARPGVRSLIVMRGDRVVYERYYGGASARQSKNVHSASKSILQALIGIAVAQGVISPDESIAHYLPQYVAPGSPKAAITVRHLLTMSSGLDWTEDVTEQTIGAQPDWVRAILARQLIHPPGTTFTYSSGNTHLLSAVLQAATRVSTCAFAQRYLFGPMGITPERWVRDPRGIFAGGFDLYLTPRELARFGQLYLDGGRYRGSQLVPAAVVREAQYRMFTDPTDVNYGYASGWWLTTVGGYPAQAAWGWGGQYLLLVPQLNLLVSTTQDTQGNSAAVDARELDIRWFANHYVAAGIRR